MPVNYLYAYVLPSGHIKIGTTTSLQSRQKQHSSAGVPIVFFDTIKINKLELDGSLKSALISLDKQVKLKNSSSTEVFNISEEETKAIFAYVKTFQNMSPVILKRILSPETSCDHKIVTLQEVKNSYTTNKFINFRFQRIPDADHVEDLKTYIMTNYMKLAFVMPSITLVKLGESYEIVDGMHRCMSLVTIPDSHPCLKYKIPISCYDIPLSDIDRINIFRTINKSKPVHEIYLDPNATKSILNKVIGQLHQSFGKSITEKNETNVYLEQKHISDLFTMENINKLMQLNKIKCISEKELVKLILDINKFIHTSLIEINESIFDPDYDYEDISEDELEAIHEFLNRINKSNSKLNQGKYKKLFNYIREEHTLRINGKKELKKKQTYSASFFVLNLVDFSKTNLYNLIILD